MEGISFIKNKEDPPYYYLKVQFESSMQQDLDVVQMKTIINHGLKQLFGDLGAALIVDVLKFTEKHSEVILRVENKGLQKLWSSLSWFHSYRDAKFVFHVEKVSSCLMAVTVNSRNYQHSIVL